MDSLIHGCRWKPLYKLACSNLHQAAWSSCQFHLSFLDEQRLVSTDVRWQRWEAGIHNLWPWTSNIRTVMLAEIIQSVQHLLGDTEGCCSQYHNCAWWCIKFLYSHIFDRLKHQRAPSLLLAPTLTSFHRHTKNESLSSNLYTRHSVKNFQDFESHTSHRRVLWKCRQQVSHRLVSESWRKWSTTAQQVWCIQGWIGKWVIILWEERYVINLPSLCMRVI